MYVTSLRSELKCSIFTVVKFYLFNFYTQHGDGLILSPNMQLIFCVLNI